MASKKVAAIWFLALMLAQQAVSQDSALREAARLDAAHQCSEAERFYQQALAQGSPSLALSNNLGNHYVLCGDVEKARSYFERVLQMNPQHANANFQLARIATDQHQGMRALQYLARVADSQPATRLLRAEALGGQAGCGADDAGRFSERGCRGSTPGLSLRIDLRQDRSL
jgi:tetratricopeptide (TPR) repeat protein